MRGKGDRGAPMEAIRAAEVRLVTRFPVPLRNALARSNGFVLDTDRGSFVMYPVADLFDRDTIRRTAVDIVYENENGWLSGRWPKTLVAIGDSNGMRLLLHRNPAPMSDREVFLLDCAEGGDVELCEDDVDGLLARSAT